MNNIFNISDVISWLQDNGLPLILILLIFFVAYEVVIFASSRVMHVALKALGESGRTKAEFLFSPIVKRVIRIVFLVLIVLYAAPIFGINIGPLIAGIGAGGLAIGFASQLFIRDVISGLILLAENKIRKGDKITIGSTVGTVEDFELRGIYIRGEEGHSTFVPFGEIRIITKM